MECDPRLTESAASDRAQIQMPSLLVRAILRRKRWVAAAVLLAIASAFVFHQLSGPWHKANAQLLVRKKSLETSPISGPPSPGQPQDDYLATHMLIIRSPRVVREAVAKGNLVSLAGLQQQGGLATAIHSLSSSIFAEQGEGSPELRLTKSIVDALKVSADNPKPGLGVSHEVINVTFQGRDAKVCAKVLDAIIASYQDFLRDTYKSGSVETLELIDRARDILRKDLNTKEAAYREFRRKTPLLWKGKDGNGTTVHQDRLFSIDAQRQALRLRSAEIQATLAAIENALKGGSNYSDVLPLVTGVPANKEIITPTQLSTPRTNGEPWNVGRSARETLEEQWINLQLEEKRLLQGGLGPAHPDVRAIRDRIEGVRGMISPSAAAEGLGEDKAWVEGFVKLRIRLLKQELAANARTDKSLAALFEYDQKEANESTLHEIEDESLRADLERSKLLYESIIKRLQEIDSVKDFGGYNMYVLEPPQGKLHIRQYFLVLAAALVVGLIAGFGGACLAEMRDKSFRAPHEACHWLGLPVLGQVPLVAANRVQLYKAGTQELHGTLAEAHRALRTALLFTTNAATHRVIQITSPCAGDGKTTLAANLGFSLAQSGKKVLLIDADLRHPRLHTLFGLADRIGLSSFLTDQADLSDAILRTDVPGLALLPSGPRQHNPAELLTSPRLKELLDTLRGDFDYILIDTPPLLTVSDPCVVVQRADAVLLVIRNSRNCRPRAQQARAVLDTMGAKILGIVLNRVGRRFGPGSHGSPLYQAALDRSTPQVPPARRDLHGAPN
jgi:polysaccharide biosynthesis transport protein